MLNEEGKRKAKKGGKEDIMERKKGRSVEPSAEERAKRWKDVQNGV